MPEAVGGGDAGRQREHAPARARVVRVDHAADALRLHVEELDAGWAGHLTAARGRAAIRATARRGAGGDDEEQGEQDESAHRIPPSWFLHYVGDAAGGPGTSRPCPSVEEAWIAASSSPPLQRRWFSGCARSAAPRPRGGTPLALVTADLESSIVAVGHGTGKVLRRLATAAGPASIESIGRSARLSPTRRKES